MPDKNRVLIVEDEKDQAEMIKEFLRLSGPFATEWSPTVTSMWQHLTASRYDIILMDYKLPDGNGLNAIRDVHSRGYDLPIVMITGQGDERLAVQAMQQGAADYLVKGTDDMLRLPTLIEKTIRSHELQRSVERSLEQIRYQALLLNNVRDAVVVWDIQNTITYWNPAAEALYGKKAKDSIGLPMEESYARAFTPPVLTPSAESTGGLEIERYFHTRQGRKRWVSSRVSALRDYGSNGRLVGYMDVTREISERKHMEAQIQAAQTKLTQAARLAAVGELAGGVAHHINNPLTTIIAESQLLLSSLPPGEPARESAEAIEEAGWRVQQAVQRLIDFTRPPSNALEYLEINDTIEKALALVGDSFRASGVTLEIYLAKELPPLQGNARQLGDLWVNMLMLARDATSDGQPHKIRIHTRQVPKYAIQVEICDDGQPIPAEELATIFEPNLTRPIGGRGTGIELSICQEIVRQHGGEISARSDPDCGTSFRVTFQTGGIK